jgi:uncharacterized protein YjiS (DUF1127 family)
MSEKMLLSATLSWEIVARRMLGALRHVESLARAFRNRREVMTLAHLDDRALKDIGLTRVEVLGALSEPLYKDPSRILLVRSVERRARARAVAMNPAQSDDRIPETANAA